MTKENKPRPDNPADDIGLKMGSKDMAHWQGILDKLETNERNLQAETLFNDANLSIAKFQLKQATEEWERK